MDTNNEFQLPTGLTKEDYRHFKSFVTFTMFKGRTATSDKSVLLELISQHVIYTNGDSGVRPGARKIRTSTNLNANTIIRSLERLRKTGWVECLSRGSIEGTASVWRVNFKNPPIEYRRDFNYVAKMHPIALEDDIWTKYALGVRDLQILNSMYSSRKESPNGLIKARISEQTDYAHNSLTQSLESLVQARLVTHEGKRYKVAQEPCDNPKQSADDIRTFYSVDTRRADREIQHKIDRIHTAGFRSFARERNIQNLILDRTLDKEKRQSNPLTTTHKPVVMGLTPTPTKAEEKSNKVVQVITIPSSPSLMLGEIKPIKTSK
jgi:hypothetical protein